MKKLERSEMKALKGGTNAPGCEDKCLSNSDCNPEGGSTFVCACNNLPGCNKDVEYKVCEVSI